MEAVKLNIINEPISWLIIISFGVGLLLSNIKKLKIEKRTLVIVVYLLLYLLLFVGVESRILFNYPIRFIAIYLIGAFFLYSGINHIQTKETRLTGRKPLVWDAIIMGVICIVLSIVWLLI